MDVGVEELQPPGPHIHVGLFALRAVGFEGVNVENGVFSQSGEGLDQALRLDEERSGIVVCCSVVHEQRSVDVVGLEERRHLDVDVLCLPDEAALPLEGHGG